MIDGCVIGNGEVGPVTKRVLDGYKDQIEEFGVTIPVINGDVGHNIDL
jgi:metallophosphoesterase superfamily enzyme